MTRIKLAEWLNKQGFITTPEKVVTRRLSRYDTGGVYPICIEYKLPEYKSTYYMGCFVNLRQMTKMIKDGYELKVVIDKWNSYELDLIKLNNLGNVPEKL